MPTNTSKFNLVKPLKSEKYNVDVFNGNADIIDSQIYSKTEVDTALNGKVDKLMATNLVTNGDFSNGTTGWSGIASTLSGLSNTLIVTGSGTSASVRATQSNVLPYVLGQKIYVRAKLRLTVDVANEIGVDIFATGMTVQSVRVSNPLANTDYILSNVFTTTSGGSGNITLQIRHSYSSDANALNKVMEVQYVSAINLTALFGAGNEPTRMEMDKLLSVYPNSWFNGTSEIGSIGALMRATLGVQVVTPTLLNSRTGNAQYVVSNDGLVIFRGTASGGSLNTNIFVLPENIRPSATRTFPISANNAFGVVTVAVNGEVRQTVGALTNVFLDGIAFKVGVL